MISKKPTCVLTHQGKLSTLFLRCHINRSLYLLRSKHMVPDHVTAFPVYGIKIWCLHQGSFMYHMPKRRNSLSSSRSPEGVYSSFIKNSRRLTCYQFLCNFQTMDKCWWKIRLNGTNVNKRTITAKLECAKQKRETRY